MTPNKSMHRPVMDSVSRCHPDWFHSRGRGVANLIGSARVGSRLRLRKGNRALVLRFQVGHNFWRQLGIGGLLFKPFFLLGSRLKFRNLAFDFPLVNATESVVGRHFVNDA